MKTFLPKSHTSRRSGFSLFEMLTFVAILGIITTLAIPLFTTTEGVKQAADQVNAQGLATLSAAASAAGAFESDTMSAEEMALSLVKGVTVKRGALKGRTFKVPNLSEEDMKDALAFLTASEGQLRYSSERTQTSGNGTGTVM